MSQGYKTGIGYDVHAFSEEIGNEVGEFEVTIGNIKIPYNKYIIAHSDGDVLIHAMVDAILGTIGQGDIGDLFPDADKTFKDMDSAVFLKEVLDRLEKANYKLNNLDCIIIAQKLKIKPYKEQIKTRLMELTGLKAEDLNIKATTTEKLGFEGRNKGIAAQVVVSVVEK